MLKSAYFKDTHPMSILVFSSNPQIGVCIFKSINERRKNYYSL